MQLARQKPDLTEFRDSYWEILEQTFSEARMSFYLPICKGNKEQAFRLCQLNSGLCQSLYLPLLYLEVSLRNYLDRKLSSAEIFKRDDWYTTRILDFSSEHQYRLKEAADRARDDQLNYATSTSAYRRSQLFITGKKFKERDCVVSRLYFRFWVELLDPQNQGQVYLDLRPSTQQVFNTIDPNLSTIHSRLKKFVVLRNTVAHYEPIFDWQLGDDYEEILDFVRCLSAGGSKERSGQLATLLEQRTKEQFLMYWESEEIQGYRKKLLELDSASKKRRTSNGTLPSPK